MTYQGKHAEDGGTLYSCIRTHQEGIENNPDGRDDGTLAFTQQTAE